MSPKGLQMLMLYWYKTFGSFPDVNIGGIFSNMVFLVATMGGYPAMVTICQPDFEVTSDT